VNMFLLMHVWPVCSCDLDLDPMHLDVQTWPRYSKDVLAYRKTKFPVKAFKS